MKPSEAQDATACLERIEQLWQRLEHTPRYTPQYDALMSQIRAEADAFRKILDTQKEIDGQDSKD